MDIFSKPMISFETFKNHFFTHTLQVNCVFFGCVTILVFILDAIVCKIFNNMGHTIVKYEY